MAQKKQIADEAIDIRHLSQILTSKMPHVLITESCITSMQQILYEISTDSLQCWVIYTGTDKCTIYKKRST